MSLKLPSLGHIRYWIERRGPVGEIPVLRTRYSIGYAFSGYLVVVHRSPPVIKAGETHWIEERSRGTDGFPPGTYRLHADYTNSQRDVFDTQAVEFELRPAPAK